MTEKNSALEEQVLDEARRHVQRAAQLLKSLDAGRARVGWLLEDTLMYLDEIDAEDIFEAMDRLEDSVLEEDTLPSFDRPQPGAEIPRQIGSVSK